MRNNFAILLVCLVTNNVFADEAEPVAKQAPATTTYAPAQVAIVSYYSPKLKANLRAEWLYIQPGGPGTPQYTFWGARIVGMQPDCPLKTLQLKMGDVISRLDGIRVCGGMYQVQDPATGQPYWFLPQPERHFGKTVVRYIISGTHEPREGDIQLGNAGGGTNGSGMLP
jgi:hypothetical protein